MTERHVGPQSGSQLREESFPGVATAMQGPVEEDMLVRTRGVHLAVKGTGGMRREELDSL